jgi:hypothetical protein
VKDFIDLDLVVYMKKFVDEKDNFSVEDLVVEIKKIE